MSTVALIRCETYDPAAVQAAVRRGIDLLGGVAAFAQAGQKVLLKPNLLVGEHPDKCVNTHPAVFRAVATLFQAAAAQVSYGDSPATGNTAGAAKKVGLQAVAEELGIPLADFKTAVEVYNDRAMQNKKFEIVKAVLDHEVIISLPKLKTHAFEKYTGAVKNQFGCIPGVRKGEYHLKLPNALDFARMLVDLNSFVRPRLYVMDAIMAMEGNGPRGGKPRAMNLLLLSADPIALDATVCRLIDLNPEYVPTTFFGQQSGAGTYRAEDIELLGDPFDSFKQPDFDVDRTPLKPYKPKGLLSFVNNRLVPRPAIDPAKCTHCGQCIIICPTTPKSVDWVAGDKKQPPAHRYKTCIRCYCCQEVCPEGAIALQVPVIRRMFGGGKAAAR